MDTDRKILRLGAAVIVCAVVLRMLGGVGAEAVEQVLQSPKIGQALVFISTGRVVRQADMDAREHREETPESAPTEPSIPPQEETLLPVFSATDVELVLVRNWANTQVDVQALLETPLTWNLAADVPTVLILHTHGSESYQNTENSGYRTLDTGDNVVSVGDRVAEILEAAGIRVVHDRTLHDNPSYSGSYEQARKSLKTYLQENPSVLLVLDIHRDAAEDTSGKQIDHTVETAKGRAAQLMLVVGTDTGGLYHPNWQENMALAVKLHAQLEKTTPGICRDLCLRTSRFNQDVSSGALLVEVGAAGNTRQEALIAAEHLAEAIIALAKGTKAP